MLCDCVVRVAYYFVLVGFYLLRLDVPQGLVHSVKGGGIELRQVAEKSLI
jgi:hypothetical protein